MNNFQLDHVNFEAELLGYVNDEPIHVEGEGTIVQRHGIVAGTYLLRKMPRDFDPRILAACLVTGYPSACANLQHVANPFLSLPYSYVRKLDFGEKGHLILEVDCPYRDGRLMSSFKLNGNVLTDTLGLPEEITEYWSRSDENSIDATFDITWANNEQWDVTAKTQSRYVITGNPVIPPALKRTIKVTPKVVADGVFSLFQETWLS